MIKQDETQSKSKLWENRMSNSFWGSNLLTFMTELRMMFRLMDRVSDGIAPMLKYLEDHIIHAGLADMMVAAELITQV